MRKLIVLLLVAAAGLALSACDDADIRDLAYAGGPAGPGGTPSLPGPAPVNPNAFPAHPDVFEIATGPDDNSFATASSIGVGAPPQARTIFPAGDVDVVAVNLSSGTSYEIAAYRLSLHGDTYLTLYAPDMTDITPGVDNSGSGWVDRDDFVGYDSNVQFTPSSTGTHYFVVERSPTAISPVPVLTYSVQVRMLVDGDADFFSPPYDCADGDPTRFPGATEFQGDPLDYDCDGQLTPPDDGTPSGDGFEGDDSSGVAKPLNLAGGHRYEAYLRPEIYREAAGGGNLRKIFTPGDVDWARVMVPPFGQFETGVVTHYVGAQGIGVDAYDGTLALVDSDSATGFAQVVVTNSTPAPVPFYLAFYGVSGGATGTYTPYAMDMGGDADGDGYRTRGGDLGWDCDDGDAAIYPGAPGELPADGHDTNCNGQDDS